MAVFQTLFHLGKLACANILITKYPCHICLESRMFVLHFLTRSGLAVVCPVQKRCRHVRVQTSLYSLIGSSAVGFLYSVSISARYPLTNAPTPIRARDANPEPTTSPIWSWRMLKGPFPSFWNNCMLVDLREVDLDEVWRTGILLHGGAKALDCGTAERASNMLTVTNVLSIFLWFLSPRSIKRILSQNM